MRPLNALKYGAAAKPVRVTLDGTCDDEVVLAVHNFGNAIPSEALQKIFDPFVRGRVQDLASYPSGAKIARGLYVARAILTAHSGTISATSSAENGTRFEIRLPRHRAAFV
ncbi:ATP-binding protein [Variovorax soli]|uniref:sensor histidine kinase n=1 Tax=Variovorax soli TaxID=376815 RepID=UPI00286BCE7D|nr:ATP-binding protein [Variovorax soli]